MSNIRLDLDGAIVDGQALTFRSPVNCSEISGLIIYYPKEDATVSQTFQFADAHGNNVGSVDLFASDILVKVILDTHLNRAYVQNADTNAYLEAKFAGKAPAGYGLGQAKAISSADIDTTTTPGWYCIDGVLEDDGTVTLGGYKAKYWYMYVSAYGDGSNHCVQKIRPTSTDGFELIRYKNYGKWYDWEWVNPPMSLNVEYRTLERHCGKPVYTQLISLGEVAVNDVIMVSGICTSGTFRAVSLEGLIGISSTVQNCTRTLNGFPGVDYFYATGQPAEDKGCIYLGTNEKFDNAKTYYAYARIKYTLE